MSPVERTIVAAGLAAAMSATAAAGVGSPQQPTFRTGTTAVAVDVTVTDGRRAVLGLGADDFELTDNDVPQQVVATALEQLPFDLTLIVDTSASLTGRPLEQFKADVRTIAGMIDGDDRLRLVTVATRASEAFAWRAGGGDAPVDRLAAGGATAFYHALAASLLRPTEPGRRQLVVAMSDGFDNVSLLDAPDVGALAARADAVLHIVLRRTTNTAASRRTWGWVPYVGPGETRALEAAAEATGGRLRTTLPTASLVEAFRTVLDEFRTGYVLWYTPTGVAAPGWHTIDVRLKTGRHTVRARRGYEGGRR